jgi:hypothetical protein
MHYITEKQGLCQLEISKTSREVTIIYFKSIGFEEAGYEANN